MLSSDLREHATFMDLLDGRRIRKDLLLAAKKLDALTCENNQLKATIAKLPKLADGELVTDPYSFIWHPEFGECMPISGKRARPWADRYYHNIRPIAECYKTCEAARKAIEKAKCEAAEAEKKPVYRGHQYDPMDSEGLSEGKERKTAEATGDK